MKCDWLRCAKLLIRPVKLSNKIRVSGNSFGAMSIPRYRRREDNYGKGNRENQT